MEELPNKYEIEKIPETLYRGITLKVEDFENIEFTSSLTPGSEKIDEFGDRVVSDGNEYGVYMSSNPRMVKTAYYGRSLESIQSLPFVRNFSNGFERIIPLPSVGIFFEISTQNLNVRKPKITSQLNGVRNNGFEGDEYIAEKIPPSNYKISEICLSSDPYDKDALKFKIFSDTDYANAKKNIISKFNDIKTKSIQFVDEINKLSKEERSNPRLVNSIYMKYF